MSPQYMPRKRKSVQSHLKSGLTCPVVQRMPEGGSGSNTAGFTQNDESRDRDALKMKRTYGRKRYEDLQSVSMGTVEYPTTSCSLADAANGVNPGSMAPPTARLPPRLLAKDLWPRCSEPGREQDQSWRDRGPGVWAPGRDRGQDQVWSPGRDPLGHSCQNQTWTAGRDRGHTGQDQAWMMGRDQGPEQGWGAGRDRGQDQGWNTGSRTPGRDQVPSGPEQMWGSGQNQDQVWSSTSRDRGHASRPGSDGATVGEASTVPPSEDQKPPVFATKKEPPTYPPGSPEERWQVLIMAKGRVTCPKCKSVSRKTVDGLKKHMENCRLEPFTCQHCGKQLKSSTGMKYHIMADHSHLPSVDDVKDLDDRVIKDKLRKILKRLGKLKCSKEGCTAAFTSIMGYVYHMKKCGKEESELEKLLLNCCHCGKTYRSRAGLEYHLKSEHAPAPIKSEEDESLEAEREANPERTASGRVQRASAQVANFHLAEIANNDLPKDWPKRKFQSDLVPDVQKLKYARPGLPAFSQEVLRKWKNEVKLQRKVHCPNQGCGSTYTSVSGLKAHLGLCTRGDFEAGKYRCLICNKEFNSESGVKYHINSVHSQDWFVTNKKAYKKFEKFLKNQPKEFVHNVDKQVMDQYHHHHHHHLQQQQQQQDLQHHHHHHHHHHLLQYQPIQHPLQPLHHLQHQTQHQFLHQDHQNLPPPPQQDTELHFTPLEPPPGPLWVDMDRRGAQLEMEMANVDKAGEDGSDTRNEEKLKADVKRKECFVFAGSSSHNNSSGLFSESEVEQQDRQRQIDQWNLKRPGNMEHHPEDRKGQHST